MYGGVILYKKLPEKVLLPKRFRWLDVDLTPLRRLQKPEEAGSGDTAFCGTVMAMVWRCG